MKRYSMVLILFVFLFSFSLGVFGESVYSIDTLNNTSIKISSSQINVKTKVMVEKGSEKYYYNVNNGEEIIPLQMGKGIYTVKVLENISGKKYKVVEKKEINIKNEVSQELYLASNQPIYWIEQKNTVELGKKITKDLKSNEDKVQAVYDYVIENIKYDYNKIKNIDDSYVPELDLVLSTGQGICYDYASLFAGVLRSQGIPTKLVKGYKNDLDAYHAWNEVLIDENWVIIDTTYDAALKDSKVKTSMIKSVDEYKVERVY
jgi:transglutaminase-like putative cysteine protease